MARTGIVLFKARIANQADLHHDGAGAVGQLVESGPKPEKALKPLETSTSSGNSTE